MITWQLSAGFLLGLLAGLAILARAVHLSQPRRPTRVLELYRQPPDRRVFIVEAAAGRPGRAANAPGVPRMGDPHPHGRRTVVGVDAASINCGLWKVTVTYGAADAPA